MLKYAIALAQKGLQIFPLTPRTKIPLAKSNGCLDATADEKQIREWWAKTPGANIGIATGGESGLWVLDIDGDDGFKSMADLTRVAGIWPKTPATTTGSGGFHYLFKHPGFRVSNSRRKMPGIDTRGDGGYIVAPPSVHPNGEKYEWQNGLSIFEIEPADAPQSIMRAFAIEDTDVSDKIKSIQGDVKPHPKICEILLARSIKQAHENKERHPMAVWLAKQLQDNRVEYADAETVMLQYQSELEVVDWNPTRRMKPEEATRVLRHTYEKLTPREPWNIAEQESGESEKKFAPEIANFDITAGPDGKDTMTPRRIGNIFATAMGATGGWPKSTPAGLFSVVQTKPTQIRNAPSLFALFHSHAPVSWSRGGGCVTKDEFFQYCNTSCDAYDAIEIVPHFPPRESVFYLHQEIPEPTGQDLEKFLSFFSPETQEDYYLISAMVLSLFAGLPYGSTPIFIIDSDAGQGSGKTTLTTMCGDLVGGIIDFRQERKGQTVQPITTRILNGDCSSRLCRYDNVKDSWDSSHLESVVTIPTISGHKLYGGNVVKSNNLIWMVTNNGTCVSEDLSTRSIIIKLAAQDTAPGKWFKAAAAFVRDRRWNIIADIQAVLATPPQPIDEVTRFGVWEGEIIGRISGAQQIQQTIHERQEDASQDRDTAAEVRDVFIKRISERGMIPDLDYILIPVKDASDWYREATNKRHLSAKAARRELDQLSGKGIHELVKNTDNSHGVRMWGWVGLHFKGEKKPVILPESQTNQADGWWNDK